MRLNAIPLACAALLFCGAAAVTALPVAPGGGSGEFTWFDGLGDTADFPAFGTDPTLEIAPLVDSFYDVFVDDCCVIGDEFGLLVDGLLTSWTTAGGPPSSLFHAEKISLYLPAGLHTIDFLVTADCCGGGLGYWEIAPGLAPEPSAIALLVAGLLGLGAIRLRSRRP